MRRFFSVMFFVANAYCTLFAEPLQSDMKTDVKTRRLEDIFPADICDTLRTNGKIQQSFFKQEGLTYTYLPSGNIEREIKDFWSDSGCAYLNETVFLYKKPEQMERSGYRSKNTDTPLSEDSSAASETPDSMASIEFVLKSISDLEGIMYFSNSRQEERLLYKTVFCISDMESKQRIPDPLEADADGLSVLVLQEDLTFGENIYRFSYRKDDNQIALFYENQTALEMLFFDVIKPGNMKNVLLVEDLGEEILFYGLIRANYLSVPGMQKRINASLSSRMDAMYDWFISSYEKTVYGSN